MAILLHLYNTETNQAGYGIAPIEALQCGIADTNKLKIDNTDIEGYLHDKIVAGTGIELTESETEGSKKITLNNTLPSYWEELRNTDSPNDTTPAHSWGVKGDENDIDAILLPKNDGAFTLHVPDSATTGGNKRGRKAIDLQRSRENANQVSEGDNTFLGTTKNCRAIGNYSSIPYGENCITNEKYSEAKGKDAEGIHEGGLTFSNGKFTNAGVAQSNIVIMRGISQKDDEVELFIDETSARLVILEGHSYSLEINIVAARDNGVSSDDSAAWASHVLHGLLSRDGNNVGFATTITNQAPTSYLYSGNDWKVSIDYVGYALRIRVKGDTDNNNWIYWVATLRFSELELSS